MIKDLRSNPDEALAEFLDINFGSESGITCLSSAPLLLQQCEADLNFVQSELSADGSIGKGLLSAIESISRRVHVKTLMLTICFDHYHPIPAGNRGESS
jgi:hypothetical protein